MKIGDEIKQERFYSEYQKAHLNILFTASFLGKVVSDKLKPFKISRQQFNILRILRGMHPHPATVKLLSERMIDRMSNASRLVDKLSKKGLVIRSQSNVDRRRVDVAISSHGLTLLAEASKVIESEIHKNLSRISTEEAQQLNELLDKVRG